MANPPGTSIEVPCGTDLNGGTINLYNNLYSSNPLATAMYRMAFSTTDAGGAGNYNFLFTSGPCTNYFQNKWTKSTTPFTGISAVLNTVETYYFCNTSGSGNPPGCVDWGNTDITLSSGKYYTTNFVDNGYANTSAIFFETSTAPATINTVTYSYNNTSGGCNGAGGLIITVNCNAAPSSEENFFIRYSTTSNFSASSFAPVVFADTTQLNAGKAVIPFNAGTQYYFYALSTTLSYSALQTSYSTYSTTDVATLMANTNGGSNYSYTFPASTSAANTLSGDYLIDNTAGVYFPSSFAFASLANAITATNNNGVCDEVVIQVPAGYIETAPTGGFVIKYAASVSVSTSSAPLTIRAMGSGTHPLLTAWNNSSGSITAGSSSTGDGVFKIVGADYVTIDRIDLQENSANVSAGPYMEYGYALLKESATNGAQHNTISNCAITLKRQNNTSPGSTGNETGSTGIACLNMTNSSSSNLTVTATSGANSYNKFTGNTSANCFNGIVVKGYNHSSPYTFYDLYNNVGGNLTTSGNIISNYGGSGSVAAYGIYLIYQNNDSVRYNTVDNLASGGIPHTNTTYGIFHSTSTNSSAFIGFNTISVAKANNSNDLTAFRSGISGTGKVEFTYNTITNCSSAGGSGIFYGVYMASGSTIQNITWNNIIDNTSVNSTGSAYLIYPNNSGSTTINVTDNTISSFTKTSVGGSIYVYNGVAGSPGGTQNVLRNTISDITAFGSTNVYGIFAQVFTVSTQNLYVQDNIISNFITDGTVATTMMGILVDQNNNSKNPEITGNIVSGLSGGATITGIYGGVSASGSNYTKISNNIIHDLYSTVGDVFGIQGNNSDLIIGGNIIYLLTSTANRVTRGIYFLGYLDVQCYSNKIYDLIAYGPSGETYGIFDDNSASDHDVYNNIIGRLEAPQSSGDNPVSCFQSGNNMSPPIRIYNNTFYLNTSSSGTNFGSAAVCITTNGFANTFFYLKNNILVNLSTPNGTGVTAALKVTETNLSQYETPSNNNLFYAGTPSASRVLFYNGTNGYQDTTSFKAAAAPRESNSVSAMPDFLNTTDGVLSDFLHIDPTGDLTGFIDMQALPIDNEEGLYGNTLTIDTDFDLDVRDNTTPDIGADEFTPIEILPIVLANFSVFSYEDNAMLQWTTASEINSDYFGVERSIDGSTFIEVGREKANGNSLLSSDYEFPDEDFSELNANRIYYRLRLVDLDSRSSYSPVRWLDHSFNNTSVEAFPNPFTGILQVAIIADKSTNVIFDLADIYGHVIIHEVKSMESGSDFFELNFPENTSSGIYFLNVRMNEEWFQKKVVKH